MDNIKFNFMGRIINNINIELLEHGHLFADKTWQHLNVTSPFNRLYFVLNGYGCLENSAHRITLEPGRMYIIPLNTTYNYYCDNTLEKLYIHFRVDIFFGRDVFEDLSSCITLPFDVPYTNDLLKKLETNKLESVFLFKSFLFKAIYEFMENLSYNSGTQVEIACKYQDMYRFVKNNCSVGLTPYKLAESLNIPYTALSTAFKRDTGYSLKNYLDSAILQSARDKLLLTDIPVREIAFQLEFTDEFYFSRFFKKHSGVSPREYRNKNKITGKKGL